MKMFLIKISTVFLHVFFVNSAFAFEAPSQSESQLFREVNKTEGIVIAQSERGCCVLRTSRVKCAYTGKQYCKVQAKNAVVKFEFHQGTSCREISSCPAR